MRLRSGTTLHKFCVSTDMGVNINFSELLIPLETSLNQIKQSLEINIEKVEKSIKEIKSTFDEKLKVYNERIDNLQTNVAKIQAVIHENVTNKDIKIRNLEERVCKLEKFAYFNHHVIAMQGRKLDDQEQVSRKVNLKLTGIEVGRNDSPDKIMSKIKDEAFALNLEIAFDRCHRIGRKYKIQDKLFQPVLLKLCSWSSRDIFYQNRKSFSFKVSADLTTRRQELLDFAIDETTVVDNLYVDFIFADKNCKLKIKSISGKYLGFNSKDEYYSLISRLSFEHFETDEHKADIADGKEINCVNDLYY